MENKDNKSEMIKSVAFRLFLDRGYDATTMRMLSRSLSKNIKRVDEALGF